MSAFDSETFGQDASFRLEQPIGSMSISPCGRDVVLASREGLHIIDLDSPYSPPRYLPHHTSWEVADVQWSPFASRDYWVVSTSNQKALVWNLNLRWQDAIQIVLHGHMRAITDINFSAHHPDELATCAVDTFVHCWDLRVPLRPVVSFSDWFAGATQVKWSRQDAHVVASSHDKKLHIWDKRNGARPVRTIEAHQTKIYGLDWNRVEPNKIVTCSLDKTIKFWNFDNPEDVPERVIETQFPVWRARHTPFGWGLLAMPQRGINDLYLYDRRPSAGQLVSGLVKPVATFSGHRGQVKEFLWRSRGNVVNGIDHRDFQLVSWATDRELKLHRMEAEVLERIGFEKGVSEVKRLRFTRKGATYRTYRDEKPPREPPGPPMAHRDSLSHSPSFVRHRASPSVGMSTAAIPQFRGWIQGGGGTLRVGMHGKSSIRQDMNPIVWMKNVRITSWDPDSLADEITQVGEKFSKVRFESVDIQQRKATISIHGPWGEENAPVYMRIDMRFPKLYPGEANAVFNVQKTSSMPESLVELLSTEMQTISETYASRRKGCVEAILRYLLREQSMEQIVSLVLDETMADSRFLDGSVLQNGASSDDDDDDDEPPIKDNPALLNASANARVPLAKACGALWSESGKLVCFFPPKPKAVPSFSDTLKATELEPSDSDIVFQGFGRLQANGSARGATLGTKATDDDEISISSDSSGSSSGSTDTSSDVVTALPSGFLPHSSWHLNPGGLQHKPRSAANSTHSAMFDLGRSGELTRINFVSIHDFETLLPSRRSLAAGYQIFGSAPLICEHNATVAEQASNEVATSVWRLAKLILQNDLPLECFADMKSGRDIISLARSTAGSLRRKNSAIALSASKEAEPRNFTMRGRVRWGQSPLGPGYLIPAIFDYFEAVADVQMLAMLSCVFAEPLAPKLNVLNDLPRNAERSMQLKAPAFCIDYYPSLEVAHSILAEAAAPTFETSNRLMIPVKVGRDSTSPPSGASNDTPDIHRGLGPPASLSTEGGPIQDNRKLSRVSGIMARELRSSDVSSVNSTAVSVSTSPEESRLSRRSNNSLAYSASRVSLVALAQAYAHSPTAGATSHAILSGSTKHSPSGSPATGGWFPSTLGSRASRPSANISAASSDEHRGPSFLSLPSSTKRHQGGETAQSNTTAFRATLSSSTITERPNGKRVVKIKMSLHNQSEFDHDGYASVPLLDPRLEWKYKSYRAAYANLLSSWELFAQMAEVLKFDGLESYFGPTGISKAVIPSQQDPEYVLGRARRRRAEADSESETTAPKPGLEVRQCCRDCGRPLAAIEKNGIPIGWHCVTPSCPTSRGKPIRRAVCSVCSKLVKGLMVPCLECGHLTCHPCGIVWFGLDHPSDISAAFDTEGKHGDAEDEVLDANEHSCPTGCGCFCSYLEVIHVPTPPEHHDQPQTKDHRLPPPVILKPLSPEKQRTNRLMSEHGPDKAIGAFLSMTRARSISSAKDGAAAAVDEGKVQDWQQVEDEQDSEPDPWARSKFANLGRGIGGGLSRGLSNKASDSTIRKMSKQKEAR